MSNVNQTGSTAHGLPENDDGISRTLVRARASGAALTGFPGEVPDTLDQAYAIQSASIAKWPDSVAGWKVGMLSPQDQGRYSAERLTGPIFRSQIHEVSVGSRTTMPIFVGGFAAIEAEFVFELGDTITPDHRQWSEDELLGLVTGLYVGAEIASSPIPNINDLGPTVVVSDFGNNAGLVLGPEIPGWQAMQAAELPVRVQVDGHVVGEASAAAIPGGPIAALRFAVALASKRGIELPAGTLVSTGAATGIHNVRTASLSRVEFGDYGWFEVMFEPMGNGQ